MGWIGSSISTWNLIPSRHFGSHLLPIPSLFSIQHQMSVHLRVKVNRLPCPQIPCTWMASTFYFPESSVHHPHNMLLPAPGHLGDLWLFCPPSVPLVPFTVSVKSIQTHTKSNVLPYDTAELWPVNIRWAEGGRAVVWRLYWKTGLALETSAGITMKTHFCQVMVVYAFNLRT